MPAILDPIKESARVAAVRASLHRDQRWVVAIRPENFTAAGKRRRGQNSFRTGLESMAFRLAVTYAGAVLGALTSSGASAH